MGYRHLTQEERYQIHTCKRLGVSVRKTARLLGRSASTISREIKRNTGGNGYRGKQAHEFAQRRAKQSRSRRRITASMWHGVRVLLRRQWSPEQISRRAAREGTARISAEWIYQFIARDRRAGGQLWRELRHGQLCRRRAYHRARRRKSPIRFRVGIEHRPAEVEGRSVLGHWEADTIVGRRRKGSVVTLAERTSRYVRLGRPHGSTAYDTAQAITRRLRPFSARVRSITFDNGMEFARHPRVAHDLNAQTFFAEPYHPWQRGTNENTNGLIRQYLPKAIPLDSVTDKDLERIEQRLNNRPRKCLGFRTPREVFNDTSQTLTVALRG